MDKIRSHANSQSLTAARKKISRQHPAADELRKQICGKFWWLFGTLKFIFQIKAFFRSTPDSLGSPIARRTRCPQHAGWQLSGVPAPAFCPICPLCGSTEHT